MERECGDPLARKPQSTDVSRSYSIRSQAGQLTGERETFARFADGETQHVADNYRNLHKPARTLADREWKGRTELKLVPGARAAGM